MKHVITAIAVVAMVALMVMVSGVAHALSVNGASSTLTMDATISFDDDLVLTFVSGHGMNGADAYVYTDVGGSVEEDEEKLGTWPDDTSSFSASAATSDGAANGSVAVNTAGFDYSIAADALVQGLDIGDEGVALGDGYAWPDWLRTDHAGTATITIGYSYTLDATDTTNDATSWVYMNAFFADHPGTNYLTAQGDWTIGYGDNEDTTVAIYTDEVAAGESTSVTGSVSWDIDIPSTGEPYNWWSLWAYGEAGVDVTPIPEPMSMVMLGALGAGMLAARKARRK